MGYITAKSYDKPPLEFKTIETINGREL